MSSSHQGEYKAQKEAVWAITNLTAGGSIEQIVYVVQAGAMKPLCDLLVVKETKIVTVILDALINILNVSEGSTHIGGQRNYCFSELNFFS